ncbi:hypothetical protein BGY98DRAFT_1039737, partial [Russula aff. rugulosa BPL654]
RQTDAPLIPDAYICLLGIQCLVSLSDGSQGMASLSTSRLKTPTGSTEPVHAPATQPMTLPRPSPHWATAGRPYCDSLLPLPPLDPSWDFSMKFGR